MQARLVVRDFVNCRFEGVDDKTKALMCEALKFHVPEARHMPQYKLGRWDGTVSFCTQAGNTFINVIDRVLPILVAANYQIELIDRRPDYQFSFPNIDERYFANCLWPEGHVNAGQPILLRDYQVTAINLFLSNLTSIQQIVMGAGKTILTAALSRLVELVGRSIVIVPSKSLVRQTEIDYRNVGLDVGVYYGDRKEYGHQHTICTWQSLVSLAKRSRTKAKASTLTALIDGVICVICDECHTTKGKELKSLLCGALSHVPIRWGVTGSVPKEDHESMCLLAAIGPLIGTLSAAELQEKKVLAHCTIEVRQLIDPDYEFVDYQEEHEFLLTDPTRLAYVAKLIKGWAATGNTMVLVDRIESGKHLQALIPDSVFISGKTKEATRQLEYNSIQTATNKIIIATYGIAAVGINIPRLFNLVILEPGKAYVRNTQAAGRILRRANDKSDAVIFDVCSSLKFSARHLTKRKSYYTEAGYPLKQVKLRYL